MSSIDKEPSKSTEDRDIQSSLAFGSSLPPPTGSAPGLVRQRKTYTRGGRLATEITYKELEDLFHVPADRAASLLGMSLTLFKRICRAHGLERWPYKKPKKDPSDSDRLWEMGFNPYSGIHMPSVTPGTLMEDNTNQGDGANLNDSILLLLQTLQQQQQQQPEPHQQLAPTPLTLLSPQPQPQLSPLLQTQLPTAIKQQTQPLAQQQQQQNELAIFLAALVQAAASSQEQTGTAQLPQQRSIAAGLEVIRQVLNILAENNYFGIP